MTNPLLDDHVLPPFDSIQPEHVVPAIKSLVDKAENTLSLLLSIDEVPM